MKTLKVNVVGNAATVSSRFNKLGFQVIETKDALRGSAPVPKADTGDLPKLSVFNSFRFK